MLVVINGPIASGKSTVARALADQLRSGGRTVAVVDLDLLYDMLADPVGPKADHTKWRVARRAAAALTDGFFAAGIDDVIAEGDFFSPDERDEFVRDLTSQEGARVVVLQVSYEEALRRAQCDPTRTVSRDPSFLRPYYENVQASFASIPSGDLVLRTEGRDAGEVAGAIRAWLAKALDRSAG